jgi:hypothetical protein
MCFGRQPGIGPICHPKLPLNPGERELFVTLRPLNMFNTFNINIL